MSTSQKLFSTKTDLQFGEITHHKFAIYMSITLSYFLDFIQFMFQRESEDTR
jgi:hypothetical protein